MVIYMGIDYLDYYQEEKECQADLLGIPYKTQ